MKKGKERKGKIRKEEGGIRAGEARGVAFEME